MEELDLKELIAIFMKKKLLIILVVIIFALIGAIYTLKFITPMYESTTSLVLVQTGAENVADISNSITTTDITLNSKLVNNYKEIAESKNVAGAVIQKLGLDMSIETLQNSISVTSISDTELIEITVEHTDPNMACTIAKEVAVTFMERVNEVYSLSNVYVLDEAEVENEPSNINLAKNVVIFSFVGAILVFGYILLVNMLDTTIKSDTDIVRTLDIPVLASIVLTSDETKKKFKTTSTMTRKTRETYSSHDEIDDEIINNSEEIIETPNAESFGNTEQKNIERYNENEDETLNNGNGKDGIE